MAATIVWFRQDLRLRDNPALAAALTRGGPVVPVYVLDDTGEGDWPAGAASRWWLHHSLAKLGESLAERGLRLILARGPSAEILADLRKSTGAVAVYWNRRYEPAAIARDSAIKADLVRAGVEAKSFNASSLFEPQAVRNAAGKPFQVFTPYWRHCLTLPVEAPAALPSGCWPAPAKWPRSVDLAEMMLLPTIDWCAGFRDRWEPGEDGARRQLKRFLSAPVGAYADQRNTPSVTGTSVLSPHLHFGEIGPRQIWAGVQALAGDTGIFPPHRGAQVFLSEVGWREFSLHLLYHFPTTAAEPLRPDFARFPWQQDAAGLRAWQRGLTGYPIVDAGMRELWHSGWMHNRVRMIAASFLVKHLRIAWQEGARWFWDTLVDADLAANTMGWQWTAGCGADAAPYFRIFNPVLQGAKFDPDGAYVRRWVPELERMPSEFIHCPWDADDSVLVAAGVRLGESYPRPIVNHAAARDAALAALRTIRKP